MGGAPRLAEHLSRNAGLLEAVLTAASSMPLPRPAQLRADLPRALGQASDFQDVLDIVRRWAKDRQFQVGVRILRGIDRRRARRRAAWPTSPSCAIAALQPHVEAEFARRQHGTAAGRGHGRRSRSASSAAARCPSTSDLDLIFIYDVPEGSEPTRA